MGLEIELDKFLKIKTNGRDDTFSNFTNFPYEPTPYVVLQKLTNSGYIGKRDKVIDYGCGKGRVSFYISFATKAKTIGVELAERLYNAALENHKKCISSNRVEFVNHDASLYDVPSDTTAAYFFNPFSTEILAKVLEKIKKSLDENKRNFKLFFYYPSKEYLSFLEKDFMLNLIDEIDCKDHFDGDNRECILVFEII